MKKSICNIVTPVLLGATLMSCGGGGGGGRGNGASGIERQVEQEAEGSYIANFNVINNGVGGAVTGSVAITKQGNRFLAYAQLSGGYPNIVHQQRVHIGTSCPTAADDTNGDGYIDVNEAFSRTGKILFPLDSDISSQERGSSIWPSGDMYGNYFWERATAYDRFITDLREPDLNEENDYGKLGVEGKLNLDGRVVMVHGAPETANLPDTVGTKGRLRNFQTIPIACGVIRKAGPVPGTIETDASLGPANGEAQGGSSGADDGATIPVDGQYRPGETTGSTAGGETAGSTTGSNSTHSDDNGTTTGDGGFHWPWERHPRGETSGSTAGGATSGGTTTGGTTSGGTTSGGTTSGGTTTGGNYGDDDDTNPETTG